MSMISGHSGHVMGRGLASQRGHGGVIRGDEIANDNAHSAVAQDSSSRIVVGRSDFENVACRKLVAALVEEQNGGHAEKFAVVVYFSVESCDGFLARGVFECELFRVVVHMAANAEQKAGILHGHRARLPAIPSWQVVAGISAGFHVHPSWIDAFYFCAIG